MDPDTIDHIDYMNGLETAHMSNMLLFNDGHTLRVKVKLMAFWSFTSGSTEAVG